MAEEIRQVEHYSASIPNRVGEGARVLQGAGRAQLEFIPENGAAFVAAAKQAKLRLRKSTALYIHGDDRPGAVADILTRLAGRARINVFAMQAVCSGGGRYGAIVFLPAAAARKAASVLGAA